MNYVALKMLMGDKAKYLGLVFTIAFASFLLANQSSIFAGVMKNTGSQIIDVVDADIWVMDPETRYIDEAKPLTENDLLRVRGVPGVQWAVRLFKGAPRATAPDGKFRHVILMGLDDSSLVGAPHGKMLLGSIEDLRQPDAVIMDRAGFLFFFPGEPLSLGKTFELNDRRVRLVGIAESSAPFTNLPVFYTRYSQAITYVGQERNMLTYVLAGARPGVDPEALARRVEADTGLRAETGEGFFWRTFWFYFDNSGIPVNFGITIMIALIVGAVVSGQTFYIFTLENLRQFGALKAIGVTDRRLVGMILLQALVVGVVGYSIGMGLCALFFHITLQQVSTRGIILMWQSMAGTGAIILFIVILASLLSIRKVLVLEPAIVFRG